MVNSKTTGLAVASGALLAVVLTTVNWNGQTGGPSAGGPSAGGPSAGGPSAGGPSAGGPSAGGPSAGGPSAGGPSSAATGGPSAAAPPAEPSATTPPAGGAPSVSTATTTRVGQSAPAGPARLDVRPAVRVDAKPISANVNKALAYLADQQQSDGGWGQGGGWRTNAQRGGRVEGAEAEDHSDLGNTCIASLALVRAGNTTEEGEYAANLAKAVLYICAMVEKSDDDTLYATDVRDTQLQSKIGAYVDTFLAGLVLTELQGKTYGEDMENRVAGALAQVIKKVELNQQDDGRLAGNNGWAAVLSTGLNSKFLNRAAQGGQAIDATLLARDFRQSSAALDLDSGEFRGAAYTPALGAVASADSATAAEPSILGGVFSAGAGGRSGGRMGGAPSDAGVPLYQFSGNAAAISELKVTLDLQRVGALETLDSSTASAEEKAAAQSVIDQFNEVSAAHDAAINGILRRLDDRGFIAGFGNNGGEELLSYMNISETLVALGGDEWKSWDKSITENLVRIQNGDGSWSGDHCITGRTFCTAAALLTLMADRAPTPLAAATDEQNRDDQKPADQIPAEVSIESDAG